MTSEPAAPGRPRLLPDHDPAVPDAPPAPKDRSVAVAAAVAAATTVLHGLYSWQQWTALIVPSWDLGIFSQLAKAYAQLDAPVVPIKGEDFNLLGDHFHPMLVLLGPVWALWPSGLALLMVQAVLFGLSAFPLTRLATDRHGTGFGVVFGLGYGLSWGLQSAVSSQFHEMAFAVPLLAAALVAFLRERPVAAALWAAPLVFVKEDLGLTVAVLGLVIAWRFRPARWTGLGLAAWGVLWVVLAVAVFLPALNPADRYDYADRLIGLATFFTPATKGLTLLMLVTTAGIVGVRSPLFLLMVPTLAWRFAGDVEAYWGWQWHYSAILMPVAFAALLDAVVPRRPSTRAVRSPASRPTTARTSRRLPGAALAVAVATTLVLGTALPHATLLRPETWVRTWRWDPAQRALEAIPDGAVVESDLTLTAYLVPTATVYWAGNANPVPQYVVVDAYSAAWGGNPPPDAAAWASARWGIPFEIVLDDGGFQVARRVGP